MDKVIMLDGEPFMICNDIMVDDVNYLYVMSLDGKKLSLLTRQVVDGNDTVESVNDENIVKKVLGIITNQGNN